MQVQWLTVITQPKNLSQNDVLLKRRQKTGSSALIKIQLKLEKRKR